MTSDSLCNCLHPFTTLSFLRAQIKTSFHFITPTLPLNLMGQGNIPDVKPSIKSE